MNGVDVVRMINSEAVASLARTGRAPSDVFITKTAYDALKAHLKSYLPVDIHEAAGDYDRPSSPWYGSRPEDVGFASIVLHAPTGRIEVNVITNESIVVR